MFGFFRLSHESGEAAEATCENILPDHAQWLQFNRLVTRAAELREDTIARMEILSLEERASVICKVQEIAIELQHRCAVPVETLPFGAIHDLPYEQATILLYEVKRLSSEGERAGDQITALAGAYCQSMAMACLAGALSAGREQKLDYLALKHDLGEQTGKLIDSINSAACAGHS
jgi:hypothetical protein